MLIVSLRVLSFPFVAQKKFASTMPDKITSWASKDGRLLVFMYRSCELLFLTQPVNVHQVNSYALSLAF